MSWCGCGDEDEEGDSGQRQEPKPRSCTDIFWLCFFIIFWGIMILIAAFAFVYGNPLRLINGYDSFGNTCGTKKNEPMGLDIALSGLDMSEKPYLFFLDFSDVKNSLKICVKKCPDTKIDSLEEVKKFYTRTGSSLCRPDLDLNSLTEKNLTNKQSRVALSTSLGPCPKFPVYNSTTVLNRCVPLPLKEIASQLISNLYSVLNAWDTIDSILGDLFTCWREILVLTFVALVFSILMIGVLHYMAGVVAWVFMIIVSIASIAGTGLLWWTYYDLKHNLDHTPAVRYLEEVIRNEKAFLGLAIIATFITVILLLLVWVLRSRVKMLGQLFHEAASCMGALPMLFIQPLFTFLVLLAFFIFWVAVVVCLATSSYPGVKPILPFLSGSSGSPSQPLSAAFTNDKDRVPLGKNISLTNVKNDSSSSHEPLKINNHTFTIVEYLDPIWVRYMWWYYIIGLIWTSEFILSCQQMVIAGAVADWYFNGRNRESGSVISAITKLISFHLGSVAKGSFLITLLKLPRLFLTYLYAKFKKNEESSECAKCSLKCCICCFYCLEKFIRFMNQNAYTVIAIQGIHFCAAARRAFNSMVNNALQLVTINSIGDFILFLGKVFITAMTGILGLLWFKHNYELHFYAAPTVAVCIFAFFVAHCVLSLYEVVIDTLFLCMCEDKYMNGVQATTWFETAMAPKPTASGDPGTELAPINEP